MAATQKKKQQEVPAPQVEARIDRMVDGDYKTKAYASVTIAGAFAVHGLRVIETDKGRFISMPQESYKKNGETVYNDTFHAVTAEARTALVDAVNDAYEQKLQERMTSPSRSAPEGRFSRKLQQHHVQANSSLHRRRKESPLRRHSVRCRAISRKPTLPSSQRITRMQKIR